MKFFLLVILLSISIKDIESALQTVVADVVEIENEIDSIVERNVVVDEEISLLKENFSSLTEQLLDIKVSTD